MNDSTLTLAIIGHLVGDYLLQNDWMALNKKKRTLPGVIHCFLWTVAVMAFSGWCAGMDLMVIVIAAVLFITHFVQDRTQIILYWMTKINRQPKFAAPPMAPWSIIVVDNVWHIVALWVVWKFLVGGT